MREYIPVFLGGKRQQLKGKKSRFLASLRNDKPYVVGQSNPTRLVFDAVQGLFGRGIGVSQGKGGAEFLGCACAVALFFE